ncbi:MAG: DNRLRE domain-containing protein [Planctomycetota bacterium]
MHRLALTMSLALAGTAAAQNRTVTVGSAKDNTLYFSNTGALSNGAGTRMFCGNTGLITNGETRRGLIAFDPRSIPRHSTIVSVTLSMTMVQGNITGQAVTLHRVSADWGEGTSVAGSGEGGGAPATAGDATWLHTRFPNAMWQAAGGDFVAAASGSTTVSALGVQTWASTPQMVADVQAWLDNPTLNAGWMLRTVETGQNTAMAFSTKETLTPADAPALTIVYTPPVASVTSSGTGCAQGGSSPLAMAAVGLPQVGNANFGFNVTGGPAGGPGVVAAALDLSPVPLPLNASCFLYINPLSFLLSLPAAPTPTLVTFPIPGNQGLLGLDLALQAVYVNPTTLQLASSNAAAIVVGT